MKEIYLLKYNEFKDNDSDNTFPLACFEEKEDAVIFMKEHPPSKKQDYYSIEDIELLNNKDCEEKYQIAKQQVIEGKVKNEDIMIKVPRFF